MKRILLVEDNAVIAENIIAYLQLDGYEVIHCFTGTAGRELAQHTYVDLILLDVMLPGTDGFTLCRQIRKVKQDVPIIMTTAKGQLHDKGEGFACGADDYLVKPFHLEELVMRINALLRRVESKDIFQRKDIEVFLEENLVIKSGQQIHLTTKERLLLSILIDAEGRTVERTTLIEHLRGDETIWGNDGKLDVYIANLRKKLDKDLIQTIKGVGYKIDI